MIVESDKLIYSGRGGVLEEKLRSNRHLIGPVVALTRLTVERSKLPIIRI